MCQRESNLVYNEYMGFRTAFVRGFSWNVGLKIASKVLALVKLFVLARLLTQRDFGLFSLTLISISIIEVFTQTGVNTTILQTNKPISYYLNTAWVISIVRGFLISAVMLIIAWPMQLFYNEPDLIPLLLLASLIPVVRGFINPALVNMVRKLEFAKDTYFRFSLVMIEVVSAVILGIIFRSVYALIIPLLLSALAEVIFSHLFLSPKPRFQFKRVVGREIFSQTKWLSGISIFDYLNKNLDDLIIGKLLSTELLGVYRNAYSLSHSATAEVGISVIHATFPIYAKLQTEKERLKKAFLRTMIGFGFILFIPTIGLIVLPELAVTIAFGEKWLLAATILPMLALAGYVQGVIDSASTLLTVTRKYRGIIVSYAVSTTVMVVGLLTLVPWLGFKGTGLSILLARCTAFPIYWWNIRAALKDNQVKSS